MKRVYLLTSSCLVLFRGFGKKHGASGYMIWWNYSKREYHPVHWKSPNWTTISNSCSPTDWSSLRGLTSRIAINERMKIHSRIHPRTPHCFLELETMSIDRWMWASGHISYYFLPWALFFWKWADLAMSGSSSSKWRFDLVHQRWWSGFLLLNAVPLNEYTPYWIELVLFLKST